MQDILGEKLEFYKRLVTYGAIMALAGPNVDCACDNQPSSCAFSWDPKERKKNRLLLNKQKWFN